MPDEPNGGNEPQLIPTNAAIAAIACIIGGIAAQSWIAPRADGESYGLYEILGFASAAVVAGSYLLRGWIRGRD